MNDKCNILSHFGGQICRIPMIRFYSTVVSQTINRIKLKLTTLFYNHAPSSNYFIATICLPYTLAQFWPFKFVNKIEKIQWCKGVAFGYTFSKLHKVLFDIFCSDEAHAKNKVKLYLRRRNFRVVQSWALLFYQSPFYVLNLATSQCHFTT